MKNLYTYMERNIRDFVTMNYYCEVCLVLKSTAIDKLNE